MRVKCETAAAIAPVVVVHGGAWDIPPEEREAHRLGVLAAARRGLDVLSGGGSALDAVEAAVVVMEDDPALNAGTGSVLNREGAAVLDAGIMDGEYLRAGAVAAVTTAPNPVRVARRVLEASPHVMLAGSGAAAFAVEQGFPPVPPQALVVERERRRLAAWEARRQVASSVTTVPADTVGAAALDRSGRLAAAASTGGTLGKLPGRVGDTPVVGAGFYADSRVAAVACTGWGEGILRMALARAAVVRIEGGKAPESVARGLLGRLRERTRGAAGMLIVTPDARVTAAWTTPRMARGWAFAGSRGLYGAA